MSDVILDTYTLSLSRTERVLIRLLLERGGMERDELIAALYPPGHAPARPDEALRVFMYQLRNKLGVVGWTVTSNKGGRGIVATYKLERLEGGHVESVERAASRIIRKGHNLVWGETLPMLPEQYGDGEGEEEEPDGT